MKEITISVEGMSCQGCVKSVERILSKQEGVKEVNSVEIGQATFAFNEDAQNLDDVLAALNKAKFPAKLTEQTFARQLPRDKKTANQDTCIS